jgi:HlyD family secretion protein
LQQTCRNNLSQFLFLLFLCCFCAIPSGCRKEAPSLFQGYAEGEYVYVASPIAGRLEDLAVSRGQKVKTGDILFSLERDFEQAALQETEQELARAESRLADLVKGRRPSEIRAIEARLNQARSSLALAEKEWRRRQNLYRQGTISAEERDQARTTFERARQTVAEISAELATARLGARSDQVEAARAEAAGAQDRLTQSRWTFDQKQRQAPRAGLIFDTLYRPGEQVAAGRPVVVLLPPENIKIRFFVPEPVVGSLAVGQPVTVSFDGAAAPIPAAISFISPQAEYTPPVIFSRDTRSKLVFMIEARTDVRDAPLLHPGQPVDVRLGTGHD